MIRFITIVFLLVMASFSFAVEPVLYTDPISSQYACVDSLSYCDSSIETAYVKRTTSTILDHSVYVGSLSNWYGVTGDWRKYELWAYMPSNPSNVYKTSFYGYVNSSSCPAGSTYEQSTAKCKLDTPQCPVGYHLAYITNPDHTETVICESDYPSCSSIGVNPSDLVPLCSEMVGVQTCLDADGYQFNLSQCPSITCADGSTVVYPAKCPVTTCPDGFELADIGEGYGNSCIKQLPPDEAGDSCFMLAGSDQPLCVNENNSGCTYINGDFLCLNYEATPPPGSLCYSQDGKNFCVSNLPTTETERQIVTDPDGTVHTTDCTSVNVKDVPDVCKVITQNPDGSIITKSNDPSDAFKQLSLAQIGEQLKIDLSTLEKNTADTVTKLDEIKGNESDFDQSPLDFSGIDSAIDADSAALQSWINETNPMQNYADSHSFSSALASMLPSDTSCSGGIHTTIFGRNFDFEPCEKLSPLREILAWFFAVWTVWLILNITAKSIVRF